LKSSRILRWLAMYVFVVTSTALLLAAVTKPSDYEYFQPYQIAIVIIFVLGGGGLLAESLLRTVDRFCSRGDS
jgi:hypothetical protein